MDYQMEKSAGTWLVSDITIDGLSLIMAYRETFYSKVRERRLDQDALGQEPARRSQNGKQLTVRARCVLAADNWFALCLPQPNIDESGLASPRLFRSLVHGKILVRLRCPRSAKLVVKNDVSRLFCCSNQRISVSPTPATVPRLSSAANWVGSLAS
jgi:hypothetical protein